MERKGQSDSISSIKISATSEEISVMGSEPPKTNIFSNMTLVDWLLAGVFTAITAAIGRLLFPPLGWAAGILIGLLLLYLAKRRRDGVYTQNDKTPPDDDLC